MRVKRTVYKGQLYTIYLDDVPRTTRQVRRALLEALGGGWPIKWGHQYDIALPTGKRRLSVPTRMNSLTENIIADWLVLAIEAMPSELLQSNEIYRKFSQQFPVERLKQVRYYLECEVK